jgi:hypothetical protein
MLRTGIFGPIASRAVTANQIAIRQALLRLGKLVGR